MYALTEDARRELGMQGHRHVKQNFSFENFEKEWVNLMLIYLYLMGGMNLR